MSVQELSKSQLTNLKQTYYTNVLHEDEGVSYDELAKIDLLVSDEEVFKYYGDTEFTKDDFWV